jgi:hypothetical protein
MLTKNESDTINAWIAYVIAGGWLVCGAGIWAVAGWGWAAVFWGALAIFGGLAVLLLLAIADAMEPKP